MSDEEDGFVFNAAFTFDASDEEDDGANRPSFSRAAGKLQGAPRATPALLTTMSNWPALAIIWLIAWCT